MKLGEDINPLDIYERDNWICQLCGVKIDSQIRCPSPDAATIDHIIPISLGGGHTMENCQTAHKVCNQRRGNALPGGTVKIIEARSKIIDLPSQTG